MPSFYYRLSEEAHAYLAATSAKSGLSMSAVMDAIALEAQRLGWEVETPPARIKDTSDSPAARSPAALPPRDQARPRASLPPRDELGAGPPGETA